jgi:hypothetical protein
VYVATLTSDFTPLVVLVRSAGMDAMIQIMGRETNGQRAHGSDGCRPSAEHDQ